MSGYAHPDYARALDEFGTPLELPGSGGWVLVRQIPGSPNCDAMGCYPLVACHDWSQLDQDVERLTGRLVSLTVVTDPFGSHSFADLTRCFPDVVVPFKEHMIADLGHQAPTSISAHHRRNARAALTQLRIERCEDPPASLDSWVRLYQCLVDRHRLTGIRAFSRSSFQKQLSLPGLVAFRALYGDEVVSMCLWMVQGNVAYYHLGASNAVGYEHRAMFGLFWTAMDYFRQLGLQWLDLGAGAGLSANNGDGLTRFKRGWATGTRTAFFCGRILDREAYVALTRALCDHPTSYFPAYRRGEFT